MAGSLMEPLDFWVLVCLWSVQRQHKTPQVLEACKVVLVHLQLYSAHLRISSGETFTTAYDSTSQLYTMPVKP